jgi:hypothetical protein
VFVAHSIGLQSPVGSVPLMSLGDWTPSLEDCWLGTWVEKYITSGSPQCVVWLSLGKVRTGRHGYLG